MVRDGSLLDKELINSDKTDGVSAWYIWDGLNLSGHHDDGSLDILDVEVSFGSLLVVWSHDSDFLSSGDCSGEDTAESVETTLVISWDHLGDEDHERAILVTVEDRLTAWIIDWSFVEVASSVFLGLYWGWELHDDHFKKSLGGVDPLLEDILEECFSLEFFLFILKLDAKRVDHFPDLFEVSIHDVASQLSDWVHDELDESTCKHLAFTIVLISTELLLLWVEVVISPKFLHKLVTIDFELL